MPLLLSPLFTGMTLFSLLLLIPTFHSTSLYLMVKPRSWAGPKVCFQCLWLVGWACHLRGRGIAQHRKMCPCTTVLTKIYCLLPLCCSRWGLQTRTHLWIAWPDGKETNTEMKRSFQKYFIQQLRLKFCISLFHFYFIFLVIFINFANVLVKDTLETKSWSLNIGSLRSTTPYHINNVVCNICLVK